MQTLRAGPLVALALAVAVIVVQARIVAGAQTWDDVRYHTEITPPRLAAGEAVRAGELPGWWDGTSFGVPLAAEPSHGAMYPAVWFATSPRVLDWILLAHAWWLALGVAVWARRRGASEYAALGAGIAIAASGIVASCAMRGALLGLAHVPWVGLCAAQLRGLARADGASDDGARRHRHARARAAGLLALALGAVGLAGQLGILIDALVVAIALGASRATAAWLAGAIAGGLAIASAQWLPALFAIGAGAGAEVHAMPVARLLELLVPGCFGADQPARALAAVAGHAAWAPSVFVGGGLFALATVRVPGRRFAIALVVPAGGAALVGRGGAWPAWLGAPEAHVAVVAALVAVLAASGLDALFARERGAVLALAAGAVVTAIALGALGALGGVPERVLIDGGFGVACLAAAAALAWRIGAAEVPVSDRRQRREDRGPLAGGALLGVLALVVAPSVGAIGSTTPTIERVLVEDPPLWATAAATVPAPRRLYRPSTLPGAPSELPDQLATLAGTYGARWGITAVRSDDPARSPLDDRMWVASAHQGGSLLSRFGVALAILPGGAVSALVDPTGATHGAARELGHRDAWALLAYAATPPASVVEGWRFEPTTAGALARLFPPGERNGLDRGEIVLAGTGAPSQDVVEPTPCRIDRWDGGAIDLACEAHGDAYAVVSSSAADGWAVAVDDQPTPWRTADVIRRAVALAPGAHHVAWRYTAPGLLAGVLAAALATIAALALWQWGRR